MLFITHDLSVLVEVSDRLAIMYAGKIVEEGRADAVFHAPEHPYTRGARRARSPRSATTRFRRSPAGLGGDPPDPSTSPPAARSTRAAREAFEHCPTLVPELCDAGRGRSAACLLFTARGAPEPARGRA